MQIFIAFSGRPGIMSDLQSPGVPPADLKPKEQTQFYLIQAEPWRTATGGSNVKANANPVTLSCV